MIARRRPQLLALWGILLLAAFLRLFELRNGQYGSDDERLWSMALRSLALPDLPLQGIKSSIGIGNGPFQVYLVMPVAALFHSPLAGAVVVALLNVAGVYFAYRFAREFFGERVALISALLFAVSSWAVIYSRRMQAQDLIVPFQMLFFWNGARWLTRGRWQDLVLTLLWFALLSQVYILGLLHAVSLAVILALGWRRIRPLPLLSGAAVFAALSFRYWLAIVIPFNASFRNVSGGSSRVDLASVSTALLMATHKGFQTIAGQAGSVFDATSGIEAGFVVAEMALFAFGAVLLGVRLVREVRDRAAEKARVDALLLAWLAIPVLLFARHSVDLYPYYFTTLLPLPALLTALLLDRFWPRLGAPALGALTGNSLAMAGIFFAVIPGYYTHNDYGLPYQQTFNSAARLEQIAAQARVRRVYVDGDFDPSDVMSSVLKRAGLDVFWLDDYRSPEFAAPPPSDPPALYVTMADDTDTARFLREHFASSQVFLNSLPGEGAAIRGYVLQPDQVRGALDGLLTTPLNVSAANGIRLESAHLARRILPGTRTLTADVSWTWPGGKRPADLQYTLFGHLIDSNGNAVAQVDRPLLASADWLAAERVVQWLNLPVPERLSPGKYMLEIGVYDDFGAVRQALVDGSGTSLPSASLLLGPIVVAPPPSQPAPDAIPANVTFGDGISLSSYGWRGGDGKLAVDLRWAASSTPSRDYTVYVHILDGKGQMAAQADSQPLAGAFPTSTWLAGDSIADTHSLSVAPGDYTVEIGMYYVPTLERLPGGPLRFRVSVS